MAVTSIALTGIALIGHGADAPPDPTTDSAQRVYFETGSDPATDKAMTLLIGWATLALVGGSALAGGERRSRPDR